MGIVRTTEEARALAARRQVKARACPICGGLFVTRGRGLYDTESCGNRARYLRKLKDAGQEPTLHSKHNPKEVS